MAYRHYETEGLIISQRNFGEASCFYQILTQDFGLINAFAQGVRFDRSKLRNHLQKFYFLKLSLVRGREFWRIVGANNLDFSSKPSREISIFFKKISLILQRLIHGEEANSFIYQDLKQAFLLILENDQRGEGLVKLEIFIVARILIKLGYLVSPPGLDSVFLSPVFLWSAVDKIDNSRSLLIKQINDALEMTQL